MKTVLTILAAALMMGASTSAVAAKTQLNKDVVVAVSNVFVPGGFDSNSESYVVINGMFPNGCYKFKNSQINNVSTYVHEVTTMASVSQGMCIQVFVPYSTDVKLGKLQSGTHTLKFMSNDGTFLQKELVVE